jgi:hypothetical protein
MLRVLHLFFSNSSKRKATFVNGDSLSFRILQNLWNTGRKVIYNPKVLSLVKQLLLPMNFVFILDELNKLLYIVFVVVGCWAENFTLLGV